MCTAERRSDTGSSSTETDKTESNGNFDGHCNESEGSVGNRAHATDVDPAPQKLKEGTEPSTAEAGAEQQQEGTTQTYRKIIGLWVSSRESDLRGLASESSVAVRDFLSDPSVSVFGREFTIAKVKAAAKVDFDLGKFTESSKRFTGLSAWFSPEEQKEVAEATASQDRQLPNEEVSEGDGQHPAAAAFLNDSLSFGFSAGGLLFSYYIGVVFGLHDLGVITRDTRLGGASAGSLIAACYHSGLPQEVIIANCARLATDCRENGTRGRLGIVLKKFLEELLPEDIHERCNDRAFVAVSRVWPRPTAKLISEYSSKEDLISALLTSCHVPWWFDSSPWTTFRGAASYDGGLTNFIPIPPSEYGARVCCFPSKQLNSVYEIQISPDSFSEWEHGMSQMVSWAFEPADEHILDQFIAKGRADAEAWAEQCGILNLIAESKKPAPEEGARQKSRISSDGSQAVTTEAS